MNNLCHRLIKIWGWLKILWEDEEWDHAYLWIIIRHKLSLMREHHKSKDCEKYKSEASEEIDVVVKALDRLIADKYCEAEFNALHDKYPFEYIKTDYGMQLKPVPLEASKKFKALHERARREIMADSTLVCNTMRDNWFSWWS